MTKNSKAKQMGLGQQREEKKSTCQLESVCIKHTHTFVSLLSCNFSYTTLHPPTLSPLSIGPCEFGVVSGTMSICQLFNNDNVRNSWAKWLTLFCWTPTAFAAVYTVNLLYASARAFIAHRSFAFIELLTSLNSSFDSIFPKKKQTTELEIVQCTRNISCRDIRENIRHMFEFRYTQNVSSRTALQWKINTEQMDRMNWRESHRKRDDCGDWNTRD